EAPLRGARGLNDVADAGPAVPAFEYDCEARLQELLAVGRFWHDWLSIPGFGFLGWAFGLNSPFTIVSTREIDLPPRSEPVELLILVLAGPCGFRPGPAWRAGTRVQSPCFRGFTPHSPRMVLKKAVMIRGQTGP